MADIIDALVVTLGLDASGFAKGHKESQDALRKTGDVGEQTAKRLDSAWSAGLTTFSKVRTEFLGILALITAGQDVGKFITEQIKVNSALGRTAHNLGMSTKDLGTWQDAVEATGGSADDLASSLGSIVQQFQTMEGRQNLGRLFSRIGVSLTDATGKLRPFNDLLADLNRVAHGMDPALWQAWAQAAGIGTGTANLLEMDPAQVQRMLARFRPYAPSAEDVRAAQQMQEDMEEIYLRSVAFGRELLTDAIPAAHTVVTTLDDWLDRMHQWVAIDPTGPIKTLERAIEGVDWAGWLAPVINVLRALHLLPAPETPLQRRMDRYEREHSLDPGDISPPMRGAPGANPSAPRGIRNNNPLNLGYVPGQPGVIGHDQGGDVPGVPLNGFGIFPDMESGIAAELLQLYLFAARGINTVRGMVNKWVGGKGPAPEDYIRDVARAIGVDPDAPIDIHDRRVAEEYIKEAARHESGPVSDAAVRAGVEKGMRLAGLPATSDGQRFAELVRRWTPEHASYSARHHVVSSTHVTVHHLQVVTQARDPIAVASAIKNTLTAQLVRQTSSQLQ